MLLPSGGLMEDASSSSSTTTCLPTSMTAGVPACKMVHLIAGMLAKDGITVSIQRMRHTASISDEDKTLFPLIHHSIGVPSSTRSPNHAGGTDKSENHEDKIVYKELPKLLLGNQDPLAVDVDDSMTKAIITDRSC